MATAPKRRPFLGKRARQNISLLMAVIALALSILSLVLQHIEHEELVIYQGEVTHSRADFVFANAGDEPVSILEMSPIMVPGVPADFDALRRVCNERPDSVTIARINPVIVEGSKIETVQGRAVSPPFEASAAEGYALCFMVSFVDTTAKRRCAMIAGPVYLSDGSILTWPDGQRLIGSGALPNEEC